jgi:chitosanase
VNKKEIIQAIVNVFETGSPQGNYGKVTIFNDGPGNTPQITYGKAQTTSSGNLLTLLEEYSRANGLLSKAFLPYINQNLKKPDIVSDKKLLALLREAGNDPVMQKTQDAFFDRVYWTPAMNWAQKNGFTLPLSEAVIYDSFIHSGRILDFLRARFKETTPANKGNEQRWVTQYCEARRFWLANNNARPILKKTVYRPDFFLKEIKRGNWQLTQRPLVANGVLILP